MAARLLPQIFALQEHLLDDVLQLLALGLALLRVVALQDLLQADLAAQLADVAQRRAHRQLADLLDQFVHPRGHVLPLLFVLGEAGRTLRESPRLSRER